MVREVDAAFGTNRAKGFPTTSEASADLLAASNPAKHVALSSAINHHPKSNNSYYGQRIQEQLQFETETQGHAH